LKDRQKALAKQKLEYILLQHDYISPFRILFLTGTLFINNAITKKCNK